MNRFLSGEMNNERCWPTDKLVSGKFLMRKFIAYLFAVSNISNVAKNAIIHFRSRSCHARRKNFNAFCRQNFASAAISTQEWLNKTTRLTFSCQQSANLYLLAVFQTKNKTAKRTRCCEQRNFRGMYSSKLMHTNIINCYAIVLYLPRAVIRFAVLKLICRPFADGSKPSTFFPCFALRSKWNPISFTIGLVCFQLFVTYDCTSATPSNEPPPCNLLIFSRDFNALPSPKSSLFVKCDEHCARAHQRHGSSDYYVRIQFFFHLFMEVLVPSSASTFPPQLNLNTF